MASLLHVHALPSLHPSSAAVGAGTKLNRQVALRTTEKPLLPCVHLRMEFNEMELLNRLS